MAVVTRFTVDRAGLNRLLTDRNEPVALALANIGRELAGRARRLAPRGGGPGPHLANNISSKLVPSRQGGSAVEIVAAVPHAFYVATGTKPHSIGSAVFIYGGVGWRYIGLSPAGKGKIHPGTARNDFMIRAGAEMGLKIRRVA